HLGARRPPREPWKRCGGGRVQRRSGQSSKAAEPAPSGPSPADPPLTPQPSSTLERRAIARRLLAVSLCRLVATDPLWYSVDVPFFDGKAARTTRGFCRTRIRKESLTPWHAARIARRRSS